MSVPCMSEIVAAPDTDTALETIRSRGLRLTSSRRLVVTALYEADRPVTAEEIASGMYGRLPQCDLGSVYRNLETLEDAGLVRHMHMGHGPGLYAPAAREDEYVTCERCGRSEIVPPVCLEAVRAAVHAAIGYETSFAHSPLTGYCPTCQAKRHGS